MYMGLVRLVQIHSPAWIVCVAPFPNIFENYILNTFAADPLNVMTKGGSPLDPLRKVNKLILDFTKSTWRFKEITKHLF